MSSAAEQFVTRRDYLSIERDGIVRHEWIGGEMWMMTGGTGVHNRLSGRLFTRLLAVAEPQGCRTYMADMKVVTDTAGYYPDVMVVCDGNEPGEYHEERPCLIAEVLSKTTEDRDRREKWAAYQTIDSLRHYLLVSQTDTTIEHRFRTDLGWATEILGPDGILVLRCPEMSISVSAIFDGLVQPAH